MKGRDFALLTDLYELTMMQGYYETGAYNRKVVFDLFYRKNPSGSGFAITAGLQQAIEYLDGLHFTEEDIDYLRGKGIFDEGFLEYLKEFRFQGDIEAVPEGTIVYPGTPLVTVTGNVIECQLLETFLLLTINHQSLIATKANRICRAAGDGIVMEFGARRAQGPDAAVRHQLLERREALLVPGDGPDLIKYVVQHGLPDEFLSHAGAGSGDDGDPQKWFLPASLCIGRGVMFLRRQAPPLFRRGAASPGSPGARSGSKRSAASARRTSD